MLAARTSDRSLAWDVGIDNGQVALGVIVGHYEQVIAIDVSEAQLSFVMPHPRVCYVHTPQSISEDEMVDLMGGENHVDLITVAIAMHWFKLPKYYKLAKPLLPYNDMVGNPEFNTVSKRLWEASMQFWHSDAKYIIDGYRNLPFPFESELPFEGYLKFLKSSSPINLAKEQGVNLLSKEIIKELESSWGGPNLVRTITHKAFMLAGTVTE
ncbi:hypothetical protein ACJRO7_033816 [Eucalyptus globulus]|uniref:Methyltransferase type 11 domain-containing protein n=1 Tax=Eucalyptus globulus TaxID=34317 RepID=A0ABD3J198_EUCGL